MNIYSIGQWSVVEIFFKYSPSSDMQINPLRHGIITKYMYYHVAASIYSNFILKTSFY